MHMTDRAAQNNTEGGCPLFVLYYTGTNNDQASDVPPPGTRRNAVEAVLMALRVAMAASPDKTNIFIPAAQGARALREAMKCALFLSLLSLSLG